MRLKKRTVLAFCRSALAGAPVALTLSCAALRSPLEHVPPVDITIAKRTSKVGYSFLAYLNLTTTGTAVLRSCPPVDVYLCWRSAEFDPPTPDLQTCPFDPQSVCKVWQDVPWEGTNPCMWDEGEEFLRKPNSRPPRYVRVHVTAAGDTTQDLDPGDDFIQDP